MYRIDLEYWVPVVPPKTGYIPHTSFGQIKVGKIRDFVDTTLIAHKPLP